MRNLTMGHRRSLIVHYGVLGVLVIALFILGYRAVAILTSTVQHTQTPEKIAAPMSGGAALVQPPQLVSNFALTDHTGQPLSLSDLRGQPVLMFFGYTQCPDVCPTTLADYTRVKGELGSLAYDMHFAFISIDGERDTPEVLAEFLGRFDESFIGMTGSETTLRQMGVQFGLAFEQVVFGENGSQQPASEQAENYFVNHTSPSFLIDKDGYLNRVFFYGTRPDVIASNMRQFLTEGL